MFSTCAMALKVSLGAPGVENSEGVASGYCRSPIAAKHSSGSRNDDLLPTPHKRVGQGTDWSDLDSPVKGKGLAGSKIPRNSSSLSRSPTMKSAIDSLSCLEEAVVVKASNRTDRIWQQVLARKPSEGYLRERRLNVRLLLPPVVVVIFPCVYYYARVARRPGLHFTPDADVVVGFWFDYVALVFFFSAVLISIRIAYPRLRFVYRVRDAFSQSWGCLTLACLKPVTAFLTEEREKKKLGMTSSVTWTIGSKSKIERSKSMREGVQAYSNGDVYEGEFHQGRCSGSGVYHFYMSGRYEGEWVDGKYDGYGVETWARGSRYRGQYRQGLREGYGVYRFYTGDVYSGEWSNGQSHGCGVQTCEDGSRYVGEFKWGVKHGFGYYHFRNGDTYAGEYFADKMHGYGVYQFANGHRYEGAWHEGKRQGFGIYTFRNGEIQAGHWQRGTLQTHSTQNPTAGALTAVSHTKVLHVVQEARRAAAKALDVPHVDDRVNKAVAAANRAANAARVAAVKAVQKKLHNSISSPDA